MKQSRPVNRGEVFCSHSRRPIWVPLFQRVLLYIDALNYAKSFFPVGVRVSHWQLSGAAETVQRFVSAAHYSGWEVVAFIDSAYVSEETQQKWRSRREMEVLRQNRNVPQGLPVLMGDAFRRAGVKASL